MEPVILTLTNNRTLYKYSYKNTFKPKQINNLALFQPLGTFRNITEH